MTKSTLTIASIAFLAIASGAVQAQSEPPNQIEGWVTNADRSSLFQGASGFLVGSGTALSWRTDWRPAQSSQGCGGCIGGNPVIPHELAGVPTMCSEARTAPLVALQCPIPGFRLLPIAFVSACCARL